MTLMRAHYASLPSAGRRAGKCEMSVPPDLRGAAALDVCCRAGKGAFELSDRVSSAGFVLGVDPSEARIKRAIASAPDNHWAGDSWRDYLRFGVAFPEDLAEAGVPDSSYDLVYINCELNVVWNLRIALAEFARVLKPGGRLWVAQGVFLQDEGAALPQGASVGLPRVPSDNLQGNVFAHALSQSEFERLCLEAGFRSCHFGSKKQAIPDGADVSGFLGAASFISCDVRVAY